MKKIHVGFLMSYDYEKLKFSIPPVYKEADAIFIALDKDHRTWKGNPFTVDDSFFSWLEAFDVDNKITIYKDDFFIPDLDTIQNDTRERTMLSEQMGMGNWLVQVDADEIFLDFKKFVTTLRTYDHFLDKPEKQPIQIAGFLINIYKYLDNGILYVNEPTKVMLATNYPNYKRARNTKQRVIYTDNVLLHECLARTEEDLKFKLENWGHSHQLNDEFFPKWKKANENNYKELKDLFYMDPKIWKGLGYLPSRKLDTMKNLIKTQDNLKLSSWFLMKKNFGQWFKFLFK
ncbi:hypothetical protein [Psychroserpens mesophilus]|uniref:hypothetical protein n=1 Tax=Psychroserpens mesophilus TaxID=325473 RepID=UPI00058CBE17|nr:hypothetical protein [Psychroserpens mesophilus]